MRKILPTALLTLSLLTLSACQSSVSTPNAVPENTNSASPETNTVPQDYDFATQWATGISWQGPKNGTNDNQIVIDAEHVIGAQMIQTTFMTGMFTQGDFDRVFKDPASRSALDAKAKENGWEILLSLDADGVIGTQWGYTRTTDAGASFMVISATGMDCTSDTTCLNYVGNISVTSALPKDGDL